MKNNQYQRIPNHIGIIPDGNRRWAIENSLSKHQGYKYGVEPGLKLYELMIEYGIKEATIYGFTNDNTKRPNIQKESFVKSCIDVVESLASRDANILVIGNDKSRVFPNELKKYAGRRVNYGKGLMNINFLINYDWNWDLSNALGRGIIEEGKINSNIQKYIASSVIPRIDLIIRWGGRKRLSGFLPIQSVYSDIYTIDQYWPDFSSDQFINALNWYQKTDVTLGG